MKRIGIVALFVVCSFFAQDRVGVLLVSKRARPRMGKIDYLIVGRSAQTGLWGPFSSAHIPQESPQDAAVHALIEQVNAPYTLNMSEDQLRCTLDQETWYIIDNRTQYERVYISYLDRRQIKKFKMNFYDAINCRHQDLPVDALAMVRWENIEMSFRSGSDRVYAHIANDGTTKEEYRPIQLSPEFVKTLMPFFMRVSYEQGSDRRNRIY